jgi:hypothetical protein
MVKRTAPKAKTGRQPEPHSDLIDEARRDRYFEIIVVLVLLAFGTYHSISYFGHKLVPTSDFPAFAKTGREILSLQMPSSFKRTPMLGLLQVSLSYFIGGQTPELTAGRVLNAILHPLIAVLLWLLGRKIIGRSAIWLAVIVIINPWIINSMTDPIAETTLLFFVLLTVYFIFRRSRWSYLFASITSMVRYEGAALILAAFVVDVVTNKQRKERIYALLLSALASVPLGLWMLGTAWHWKSQGMGHYLNVFTDDYMKLFSEPTEQRVGLGKNLKLLWQIAFYPLLTASPKAAAGTVNTLTLASKILALITFAVGSVYGLIKQRWNILVLFIFLVPYVIVHSMYPYPIIRYYTTVHWIVVLLSILGLQGIWRLIQTRLTIPPAIVTVLQMIFLVVLIIWITRLIPFLSKIAPASPGSSAFCWVAVIVVCVLSGAYIFLYRQARSIRSLVIWVLLCLIIVSNQFVLVRILGDGQTYSEFVQLTKWYINNAGPDVKIALYFTEVPRILAPKYEASFVGLPTTDSPEQFVQECQKRNITYVVWASREMTNPGSENYKLYRLDNIAMLQKPQNIGPYRFVTQIGSRRGWVNVFRLSRPGGE